MSRLEKTMWGQTAVPLALAGSVNIPEIASPLAIDQTIKDDLSPTLSVDSGRSTSTEIWPSHNYLLYGGPGFSIAALDSSLGTVNQIPVPVPLPSLNEDPTTLFSLNSITALSIVGENQVWAGTSEGSLHVLELTPELRFQVHSLTNLSDPITCIESRQQSSSVGHRRVDVLVGTSSGNLTVLAGATNDKKGLKNSLKCSRKVLPLGGFGGSDSITCMAILMCNGVEVCWCACGSRIVVLRCSDWKQLAQFEAHNEKLPDELVSSIEVTTLLNTEPGVWTGLSHSSALTLWDRRKLCSRTRIICWDSHSAEGWLQDSMAEISAIAFTYPLLFAGTRGGHLMVFRVHEDQTDHKVTHKLVTGAHCSSAPVINIHPTCLEGGFPSSATPTPGVNVLVVSGDNNSTSNTAMLFELISSPCQSPLTSPMSINGRVSVSSTSSYPASSSLTLRRSSIIGSLPQLSLAGASLGSPTLLPLLGTD